MMRMASTLLRVSWVATCGALAFASEASAGWGDENWGEMLWGGGAPQIPSLPVEGVVLVAALLLGVTCWLLAARHRRPKRSPLNS